MQETPQTYTRQELGAIVRDELLNILREAREAREELGDDAPVTADDLRQILREELRKNFPASGGSSAT